MTDFKPLSVPFFSVMLIQLLEPLVNLLPVLINVVQLIIGLVTLLYLIIKIKRIK